MELTQARKVEASEEERMQIQEMEEFKEKAAIDRKRQNKYLEKAKREQEIMDRARNMVGIQ
jgi:hypothetical protein